MPCSTTLPRAITTIVSACRTVLSLCATITTVLPLLLAVLTLVLLLSWPASVLLMLSRAMACPARFCSARLTAASLAESRAEVASSNSRICACSRHADRQV